ncbi:gas vesicle protein GvpJ [Kitasatospora sp. NPDC047058]|uniref:gas vesicle protein GvpJ n=1 Tax=Kitasatospora sp. NPDC047058 TaxID=3155620 RepID=UPI0034070627
MTPAARTSPYLDRPSSSGLADVVDLILDKGLVIDVYVRVSLVGIELLTIDTRVVAAGVDTYLRFAEAVNRLDLEDGRSEGLPELVQDRNGGGARHRSRGALESMKDTANVATGRARGGNDEEEPEAAHERPKRRPRPAAARRERER